MELGDNNSKVYSFISSFQYKCVFEKTNRVLLLEYISYLRLIDTTILSNRSLTNRLQLMKFSNKLEYLLLYYLPYHGFPDVWIYNPNFRHEIRPSNPLQILIEYSYILNLLELYIPRMVDVVFLSDTAICDTLATNSSRHSFRLKHGTSENERIHQFNQILYHVLRPFHRYEFYKHKYKQCRLFKI